MRTTNKFFAPPSDTGQGRRQRSRWLWLVMMFVLLSGSVKTAYGQSEPAVFDYRYNGRVGNIYDTWRNWLKTHWYKSSSNGNYYHYDVLRYGAENSFRGWDINGTDGRPSTWYYFNKVGPNIYNNTWFNGETLNPWFHFKYENINEVSPDHPYVEIWVPTYDVDGSGNDATKQCALYVKDADGNDVLVAVQQYCQHQIDNYSEAFGYPYADITLNESLTYLLGSYCYNSGNYKNRADGKTSSIYPGILTNWGTFNGANTNYCVFNTQGHPEYVKLRYYPGFNIGESFDMSFIVNWDINNENQNSSTDVSYNGTYPRFKSRARIQWKTDGSFTWGDWTWSIDWSSMFVTKGIKVNNKVTAPTAERLRGGQIKLSASNVRTYTDFETFFVVENVGRLDLGHESSGNATMGSNIDHKLPLRNYSVVYRGTTVKNGSMAIDNLNMSNYSSNLGYFTGIKDHPEPVVQEFKNYYDDIPGCAYPDNVQVTFDKWSKKAIITWDAVKENRNTNGSFFVYRYEEGSDEWTLVGSAGVNDVQKVEDSGAAYNKKYIYKVSFLLNSWSQNDGPEPSLTTESEVLSTTPTYTYSATTATSKDKSVLLSWTHDTPKNDTQLTFKVWRVRDNSTLHEVNGQLLDDQGNDAFGNTPYKEVSAGSGSTTTYEDTQLASKCASYWYRITTDVLGGTFSSPLIGPATMSGNTEITNVTANRGTYSNVVKVQWDVKQVGTDKTRFVVYRSLLGSEDYQQIHVTSGTESSYYFEDNTAQPGQFYQYKVVAQNNCVDPATYESTFINASSGTADGFCQSRGIISGRITYGTGTAVPNAYVLLKKNNESGDNSKQFYSMKIDPMGGIKWTPSATAGKALFEKKPFTIQMYVRPESVTEHGSVLVQGSSDYALLLKPAADNQSQLYLKVGSAEAQATGLLIPNTQFRNVSVSCNGNTAWTVSMVNGSEVQSWNYTAAAALTWESGDVMFGCDPDLTTDGSFTGYLDDVRLWSKALTDDELLDNYDRLLIGTENGLKLYWPMDEGLDGLPYAYDYSKTSGVANENHGVKMSNTYFEPKNIPSDTQLRLYGKTDTEGNYVIRGIPFTGEGTNYTVSPDLGVHKFSPQYQTRFISSDALTHSGVDFEDVSSFTMNGYVYYENTNIPVEGAYLYVDGTICSKDGEPIMTDETGAFEISVPIGDHYVQVKKDGHTFAKKGRFPADPNETGTLYTFIKDETVTFYDATKVMIAGRVVGGKNENEKPLGFGESKANIGKAKIVLSTRSNGRYLNYIYNEATGTSSLGVNDLSFNAKYGSAIVDGTNKQNSAPHQMTIMTDATTGEFAVEVPPLDYAVESISIPSHSGYTFSSLPSINATDVLNVKTDSLEDENGNMQKFEYIASMKMEYTNNATMTITDMAHQDGAIGEKVISGKDDKGGEHSVQVYTTDEETGAVTYREGAPLLLKGKDYQYKIRAFQEYVNYDGGNNNLVVDEMPMSGSVIRIANDYANGAPICINDNNPDNIGKSARELEAEGNLPAGVELEDDELELDDKGEVIYKFTAGQPKTVHPYTRGCTIVMNDDASALWTNNVIILGNRSKGNDFVTGGPDEVTMILRDPGGSNSFTTYSTGTTTSHTKTHQFDHMLGENMEMELSAGIELTFFAGSMFFATETKFDIDATVSKGIEISEKFNYDGSSTTTTTLTEEISTSSDWDWTGAQADVFIGTGTNYIIGEATKLGYTFATDGTATFEAKDILTQGTGFTTAFNYTQNTIENVMIPNLVNLRNQLIKPMGSNLTPDTKVAKYESLVPDGDPNFGKKDYYKMIDPTDISGVKYVRDSVSYYNMQIDTWLQHLANNEKAKVQAINNRSKWLVQNKSIDGGSSYTSSVTNDTETTNTYGTTTEAKMDLKVSAGTKLNGIGYKVTSTTTSTSSYQYTTGSSETTSQTVGYTLAEDGDDDVLTIDIFKAPDNMGPIFVTKGGRTSAPYEGQEVTKYYQPGTEISAATKQIEVPKISVKNPSILQNVPSGRKAVFTLELTNDTETGEDCWFNLGVCDTTNPNGASFWISGTPLGNDRRVLVPANQTMTMTLEMSQTNESVLDYRNIGIRLFSPTQKDNTGIHHEIADTCYISATFVPAGPDVDLALSHNVLNINAGTELTLSASGYDVNYTKLTGLQMEYRKDGDNTWNLVRKFVKSSTEQLADPTNLDLLDAASESYKLNMKAMPDGVYFFRARTVCDFSGETVYGTSEEVKLVKDQSAPKLFGKANPSDGVLNADDDISVTFNEDIVTADLSQSNFVIQAAVNGQSVDHAVALKAQNTERAAYTEASYNLAKKDFSADMWVNYTGAGTLLSHGNGSEKFEVGTDASGHLTLKIGENTYTSTKTLTENKWVFLTFNYKYNGDTSKFSALFAEDATNTQLFDDATVAGYEGIGSLTVGKNLMGAIQELTLWDKARTCSEAKSEKDLTKKPSTPYLIGYWKMDEGEGKQIRDYARNRHMTLPESTWYLNNVNYAATISGSKAMKVDISACSALDTDDYAMELWFKSQQTGKAALFSAIQGQGDRVEMGFNAAGALTLTSKDTENEITATNLRDNAWHHLALNVLRNGNATVYVDGTAVKSLSASAVSALAGAQLVVGATYQGGSSYANYFNGKVDELRFWRATLSGDYINRHRNVRLKGDEAGLVAYYPFEAQSFNDQQSVVEQTAADQSVVYNATSKEYEKTGKSATMTTGSVALSDTDVPGLKPALQLTNLNYTFVANERSVIINLTDLTEHPEVLEGTTVDITVRYATDKNYNRQSDINWTAYIKQNQLVWKDETEVSVVKKGTKSATFEATITNDSGNSEYWMLSGLPSWLSTGTESGTLKAQQSKTITFTVSESLPIGKYEQIIYLTGNKNIAAPLTINVKSKGDEPLWTVNPGDFEESMNVMGQLKILNVTSRDEDDIVAAFIGNECRGVARPKYDSRYDGYFVTMDIYGNNASDDNQPIEFKPIEFKAYDASSGIIYPVVKAYKYNETQATALTFEPGMVSGRYATPMTLAATDDIEQNIELNSGWNWMSLSVKPTPMTVATVFAKADGKVNTVKSLSDVTGYSNGSWVGELTTISNTDMYAVNATEALTLSVTGQRVNTSETPITIAEGWNWIGYCGQALISVGEALAGLNPQDGDIIKGQKGVAYFDVNAWSGSLQTLVPGKGYKLQSAEGGRSFTYPATAAASRMYKEADLDGESRATGTFAPVDYSSYPTNMVLIAKVVKNGMPVNGAELGVFAGSECREAAVTDGQGMVYITIPGDKAEKLTFRVAEDEFVLKANESVNYKTDAVIGTPRAPFFIELGTATRIDGVNAELSDGDIYDLQGRKVKVDDRTRKLRKGVYIVNGQKQVK